MNNKVYIGQSVKGIGRWHEHRNAAKRGNNGALYCAMRKYGVNNFAFVILCLVRTKEDADFYERSLITEYDSIKNGYNRATGGGTTLGTQMNPESRLKISAALKGKAKTEEHRAKLALANHGRKQSEQTRKKISQAQQNRTSATVETRAKISASLRGHIVSDKTKMKIAMNPNVKSNLGRRFSEEHRLKISVALKNKKKSPEHLAKIIAINKSRVGKSMSQEARDKISAALKGRKFTEDHKRRIGETRKRKGIRLSATSLLKISKSIRIAWKNGVYENRRQN